MMKITIPVAVSESSALVSIELDPLELRVLRELVAAKLKLYPAVRAKIHGNPKLFDEQELRAAAYYRLQSRLTQASALHAVQHSVKR